MLKNEVFTKCIKFFFYSLGTWLVTKAKNTTMHLQWNYVEAKVEITKTFNVSLAFSNSIILEICILIIFSSFLFLFLLFNLNYVYEKYVNFIK